MPSPQPKFIRVALVLPTEFAYARAVLRGVIAATRERNMYKSEGASARARRNKPWLFRIYRGIYGHSGRYLRHWFDEWNPDGIIAQSHKDRLAKVYHAFARPIVELFESRAGSSFPKILPDDF